jgi:hypothetical protein
MRNVPEPNDRAGTARIVMGGILFMVLVGLVVVGYFLSKIF